MASAANSSLRNWSEPTAVLGESEDVSVGTLTPPPPHVGSVYDCEPTLNDQQVLEFCRNGYMILEGVVEDAVNRRMMAFVEAHPEHQPLQVLSEDWFVDGVIKNQQAAGAVRSLLGPNFKLPQTLCNHRAECPAPAQGWHRDGGSIYTPRLDYLQVFYYPQDTPKESGPTDVLPGSLYAKQGELHGTHSQREVSRINRRASRLNFYNGVFYLAPQIQKHDHWLPQPIQIQLLADIPTLS